MQLRYRDADAVVLYDSLVVTLGSDNHISKRRHRAVMLFTDNAINRYGDPRILFNAATQDLTILAARVRMRDGRFVDAQKNAVNQTTPFALDLAPDYVDWQETVVTHMGIEKGCIAELHYVIADRNPSPYLSGVEVFSAEDPTEERVLVVKLPQRMTLKFSSLRGEEPPPDASANGAWAWTVRIISGAHALRRRRLGRRLFSDGVLQHRRGQTTRYSRRSAHRSRGSRSLCRRACPKRYATG